LRLWSLQTGKCLKTFEGHSDLVVHVFFSKDDKYVVSGSYDKTLRLWSVETGKCLKTFIGHFDSVFSTCFFYDD
jgi:WD40 repeat protein